MTSLGIPASAQPDKPLPAPAPPGLVDPPLMQRLADGSYLALPMIQPDQWGQGYVQASGAAYDDSATINAALAQAQGYAAPAAYYQGPSSGRVVLLPNAVYNCVAQITVPWGIDLVGRGAVINFTGGSATGSSNTGACIWAHGQATGSAVIQGHGSWIMGLTVDGVNKPAGNMATGVDAGDQYELRLSDMTVQNFTQTAVTSGAAGSNPLGDVGISINNVNTLTEKFHVQATVENCATGIQMVSTSGNSTSHMYGDVDVHFNQQYGQHGLVVAHNGNYMNGWCRLRGNFWNLNSTANNPAGVIVLGVRNQAGHIQRITWDVRVESDPAGAGNTQPTTIIYGTNADNQFLSCLGTLVFLDGFQPASPAAAGFQLRGSITGDTSLSTIITPAVPGASGTMVTNTQSDCQVTIIPNTGVNLTAVTINGVNTAVPATGVTLFLPMNGTIQPFWTGVGGIGWVWYGLSAT